MSIAVQPLMAGTGALWVQPDGVNTAVAYLGFHEMGDVEEPLGDINLIYARNPEAPNSFNVIASYQGEGGPATFDIEALLQEVADYLEGIDCPVPIYVTMSNCGKPSTWSSWQRLFAFDNSTQTSRGLSSLVARDPANQDVALQTFSFAAENLYRFYRMTGQRRSVTEPNGLNAIAAGADDLCAGDCGSTSAACDLLAIGCDAAGGATANVLLSSDGGASFAAAAADPFATDENVMDVLYFSVSQTVSRILCVRDADAAAACEVAYSDDAGASWTLVVLTTANNVGALGGNAMCRVNNKVWLVLESGNICRSSDLGLTWETVDAGVATANDLYAVHMVDELNGYAVGASDTILFTEDGGDTWGSKTATGGGGDLLTVFAIDKNTVWVGTDDGELYYSLDGGTTWTIRNFSGSGAGNVNCVRFSNNLNGFLFGGSTSGVLMRTVNGGYTWEAVDTPTLPAMNELDICKDNKLFACGEVPVTNGYILYASN